MGGPKSGGRASSWRYVQHRKPSSAGGERGAALAQPRPAHAAAGPGVQVWQLGGQAARRPPPDCSYQPYLTYYLHLSVLDGGSWTTADLGWRARATGFASRVPLPSAVTRPYPPGTRIAAGNVRVFVPAQRYRRQLLPSSKRATRARGVRRRGRGVPAVAHPNAGRSESR